MAATTESITVVTIPLTDYEILIAHSKRLAEIEAHINRWDQPFAIGEEQEY
jgi:hypothetical protein